MITRRLSVLLLCDDSDGHAENLLEHIRALVTHSRHDIRTYNPVRTGRVRSLDLEQFDVLVVHYSIFVASENYVPAALHESIHDFRGLKVQFIQDEYRWVDDVTAAIRSLGIDVLFTCVPGEAIPEIYGGRLPDVVVIQTLAGFVPGDLAGVRVPPLADRPVDIGYRGRVVPYWLGRLGHEKMMIGKETLERAASYGLRTDIAWGEEDRIYGKNWYRFMMTCRATLGTESGSSIVDYDGALQRAVDDYLILNPEAKFEDVHRDVLTAYEGNTVINVVSPRVFEAAALRTALVLFPGEYSGVVQPWDHYIPLEKDFSNFDQVASMVRDTEALTTLVERTYDDVVASGKFSLQRFVEEFDGLLDERAELVGSSHGVDIRVATAEAQVRRTFRTASHALGGPIRFAGAVLRGSLALRSRPLRSLFVRFLTIRDRDEETSAREVLSDIWKLEMIRKSASSGDERRAARFDDDSGQLIIGPGVETEVRGISAGHIRAVIRDGGVRQIVWQTGSPSNDAPFPAQSLHGGKQRLRALEALVRVAPEETARALEAALSGSPRSRRT